MKKVAMMKKALAASKNPAWKWTADANGLHWSYGVDFTLTISKSPFGETEVSFEDENSGTAVMVCVINREQDAWMIDGYHDFVRTADEAMYWAAVKMIRKAEYLY